MPFNKARFQQTQNYRIIPLTLWLSMFKTKRSFPKKRNARNGVVTVELALFLPVMVLICFGSIQISSSIFLRHQAVAVLEAGSLDFMLGNVLESNLKTHLEGLALESGLTGATASVTPVETNYVKIELDVPMTENLAFPATLAKKSSLGSSFLVYRPSSL